MKRYLSSLFLLVLIYACIATVSCSPHQETVTVVIKEIEFKVEVAETPEERAEGLMFRKKLNERHGMLFVFPYDQKLSFWMKNTSIPLSIAFISKDGTIKEILDMVPFSEKPVPSTYSVRYALEVNQGEFEALGIKPGDKVILPDEI